VLTLPPRGPWDCHFSCCRRSAGRNPWAAERAPGACAATCNLAAGPAGKLARAQGSADKRPAPGQHQWSQDSAGALWRWPPVYSRTSYSSPATMFDGTMADLDRLAAPFKELAPPFGLFLHRQPRGIRRRGSTTVKRPPAPASRPEQRKGNCGRLAHCWRAQWRLATTRFRLRATLESLRLNPGEASILLNHMPSRLPIVERAGVSFAAFRPHSRRTALSFQLVHGATSSAKFTYGLQAFGRLQVYTSSGAGTWGPPMRGGTNPEIVLIEFNRRLLCYS